ncbi:hypothetical protein KUTeg_017724, partial [Tegillarca granosa]
MYHVETIRVMFQTMQARYTATGYTVAVHPKSILSIFKKCGQQSYSLRLEVRIVSNIMIKK